MPTTLLPERIASRSSGRSISDTFTLYGELSPPNFEPWIRRHAARLGIKLVVDEVNQRCIRLTLSAQPELLDAMEMACWLGPASVWVERIDRVRS